MDSIVELIKKNVDLHDLAQRLELKRPHGGNYSAPHRDDNKPSLSIYDGDTGQRWKDFSNNQGGSAIDLVMYAKGIDATEAIKLLAHWYALRADHSPLPPGPPTKKTRAAWLAEKCAGGQDDAIAYLSEQRGIDAEIIRQGYQNKTIGFNDWHADDKQPGDFGYGGPAVAFMVRQPIAWHTAVAVDFRFIDAAVNGGLKTKSLGEKSGHPWIYCHNRLRKAHTVYVVESAINALSIEQCGIRGATAIAVRGTATVESVHWRDFLGKQLVICMDNDKPDESGKSPGRMAAWKCYLAALDAGVAAICVDQSEWEHNDVNDYLREGGAGADELKYALQRFEPWAIPTVPGKSDGIRNAVYLPAHDFSKYWRYRVHKDFTSYVDEFKSTEEGEQLTINDLATFRIAAIGKVNVESLETTLSGSSGSSTSVYSVSVQQPVSGAKLVRRTFSDDRLHNVDQWSKFGGIFSKTKFLRLIAILEREALQNERTAANFVGVCYLDGKLVVNEGQDSFFTEPEKQCTYHNLSFPRGSLEDARRVIGAYQNTFEGNAATMCLVWGLGAHLKALIGYWPHMIVQANKAAGKTTLLKKLESSIAFKMLSGQSVQSDFRLLTSISCTSHPVGWEEISARKQEVIEKAVSMLQEAYQYSTTYRGSEMTQFLVCAPVILAGEDVPVRSLLAKTVQTTLDGKKGAMMDEALPVFPVRQWLDFLVSVGRRKAMEMLDEATKYCLTNCNAAVDDPGAERMAKNYAAVLTGWSLLCEFTGLDKNTGGFPADCVREMNTHIIETDADRRPFVWILELYLSEIAADRVRSPYVVDLHEQEMALIVRPSHIIDHISHSTHLRDAWGNMPVKSSRVFVRQLVDAGVLVGQCQRTINNMRLGKLAVLSVAKMESYGLCIPIKAVVSGSVVDTGHTERRTPGY